MTTCPQWDLHLRHNSPMFIGHQFHYPYTPGQPGHEATGVIEKLGPGVSGLAVGDRVSAWRDAGHDVPGCYAQYVVHRAENVIRVPAGLPDEALAPVELAMCMATVFRMLQSMNAIRGRCFGVAGLGPAGLVAVQMAKAEGAVTVLGFDLVPERRELACRVGADAAYDPQDDLAGDVPAWPAAPRLRSAVDCTGGKVSVEFLMDRTTDAVALFGVQREDYTYQPRHNRLRLCGYQGHSRESAEYAVNLIREGKLNLAPLVTHRMPLGQYVEAIDLLEAQKAVKVCFLPWQA
ncbi:zinc-binding dehydrogenase [bacterium]|nr:zinc-binding dehydrogenase [bacterium]